MTKIRENGGFVLADFGYDQLGRRERLTLGNGDVTTYEYDAASRMRKLKHDLTSGDYDNTVTFAYNSAGQIVKREATNGAYSWTGHGNGTTTYTVDGLNRLISQTTGPTVTSFSHDARGDRLNDDTRTYGYDSETKGRGAPAAPWHYDPLGRLSGASTSPTAPPAIAYESYVDNLIAERTPGSSTAQRRHVFGPGSDEPLVWYEGSSRRFLHADERGSIVSVTNDGGGLLAINRFDEYGRTETTSPTYMGRFLYTGQRYFGGFGVYHYKNRIYDPRTGQFMQPDPIGYGGGMNLYAYVKGDPINSVDPRGLKDTGNGKDEDEIVVTGKRFKQADIGPGGGFSNGSSGPIRSDGSGKSTQQKAKCKLGNGAIDVSFDGATVNITANINLVGPGAGTSGAYIGGIGKAWTQPFGYINSIANISRGDGGLTAHISSEVLPPEGRPNSALGGKEMSLGNIGAMDDWVRPFAIEHVGPHEFGHSLGIPNMPGEGKWRGSIMANSANNVSPTDLEAVVELCRAAE